MELQQRKENQEESCGDRFGFGKKSFGRKMNIKFIYKKKEILSLKKSIYFWSTKVYTFIYRKYILLGCESIYFMNQKYIL